MKRFWLILIGLTILGAMLRLHALGDQPLLDDEVNMIRSAENYMQGGHFGPTMWFHPNLRNIVLYGAGHLFGYGSYAMRGMSLIAGILSIPLTGIVLYALTRNISASLVAAFLLSVEQVHITFSRQAIQETWTILFILLGILFFIQFIKNEQLWTILLSGVLFGLGISSKEHAIFPLAACLAVGTGLTWKRQRSDAVVVSSSLILLPAAVYLLTFFPWFERGYGLDDWIMLQTSFVRLIFTHRGYPHDQVVDTEAWQWFLRPMGYADFVHSEGTPFVTLAYSNPVVWLLVLPAAAYTVQMIIKRKHFKERVQGLFLVFLLFIISYLPLALSPRPIWLISSLAVLPFAFMLVGLAASDCAASPRWGKWILPAFVSLVLISSIALYPMAIGKGRSCSALSGILEKFRPPFESGARP